MKPRVLFVSHHHFHPKKAPSEIGGMQRVSYQLVEELKTRTDIDVETWIHYRSQRWGIWGVLGFYFRVLLNLKGHVKRHSIDWVCYSSFVMGSIAAWLGPIQTCRQMAITHGLDTVKPVALYQRFILPRIFKHLSQVIAISQAVRSACIARGCIPQKIAVIPNGLSRSWLEFPVDRHAASIQIHTRYPNISGRMLLTVGRLIPRKGQYWFIRNVLPILPLDYTYVLIGDGPDEYPIRQWLATHNLSHRVHMIGAIPMASDQLKEWYQTAECFIMPNRSMEGDLEGFGIVMLEANSMGLPVVGSAVDGIKDVIHNETNGRLVHPDSPTEFLNAIDRCSRYDSQRCINWVKERFTWPTIATQYTTLFRSKI